MPEARRGFLLLLRDLGHDGLGGQHQRRRSRRRSAGPSARPWSGRSRRPRPGSRTCRPGRCSPGRLPSAADLGDDDRCPPARRWWRSSAPAPRSRGARVRRRPARRGQRSFCSASIVERRDRAQQRDAAARDDALFDRGLGRVHRVLDAGLLLLHLGLGGRADLDHRHAADQLGQPLLELLAVVVGGRLLDLRADLLDAALDLLRRAGALDDRGVVLVDRDLLGPAEVLELDVLELDAEVLGDRPCRR